jgi:NADH-ubiquinone oxidoreductase chain 4
MKNNLKIKNKIIISIYIIKYNNILNWVKNKKKNKFYIMLLHLLIVIPTLTGILLSIKNRISKLKKQKIVLISFILNFIVSLILYILFDLSLNEYQFIQKNYNIAFYNLYLGVDGISLYFILLTTMIMPIVILSN